MKKILFENQKNVVGTQLKLQRIKKGLSQSQLAAKVQTLGVSLDQRMISKIEKNDRIITDYELACLCHVLDTTPGEMLQDFYEQYL